MRKKDDKLMQRIVECFDALYKKEGRKPSTRKIGEKLGINASTVSRYLREMSDRNMLQYEGGEVKTSTTDKFCRRGMTIPILGSVSCGVPLLEEENIEAYYWLPEELFGKLVKKMGAKDAFFVIHLMWPQKENLRAILKQQEVKQYKETASGVQSKFNRRNRTVRMVGRDCGIACRDVCGKNRLVFCALCFAVLQGRLSVLRFERLDEKGEGVVAAFFANREYGVVGVAKEFGGVIDA